MSKKKIFVSHSSADKEFVRRLVDDLKQLDLTDIWFDEQTIAIGDSIPQKIEKGLKDADYVIIVLSSSSANSHWVKMELDATHMSHDTLILPVLIDDCEIPTLLKSRKYADFRNESNYESAIRELAEVLAIEQSVLPTANVGATSSECVSELVKLSNGDLRRRIASKLSRSDLGNIWWDLTGKTMDDDHPSSTLSECARLLIDRMIKSDKLSDLLEELCREAPHVARSSVNSTSKRSIRNSRAISAEVCNSGGALGLGINSGQKSFVDNLELRKNECAFTISMEIEQFTNTPAKDLFVDALAKLLFVPNATISITTVKRNSIVVTVGFADEDALNRLINMQLNGSTDLAALKARWRVQSIRFHSNEGKHVDTATNTLLEFKLGPMVLAKDIPMEIVDIFVNAFEANPSNAPRFLATAMAARERANPENKSVKSILVRPGQLPSYAAGLEEYWAEAIHLAGLRSRRTLAALMLTPGGPDLDTLSEEERTIYKDFLNFLRNPT